MHEEYDLEEEYEPPVPKRRATATPTVGHDATFAERKTESHPVIVPSRRTSHPHILVPIGIGMLLFLTGWVLITMVVQPWWHGLQVHWEYGKDNVSVFGADVGHGGMSRFIAFDSASEIVIVEVVAKKYAVYTIPVTGADNRLVTLSASDVNGDGKPDLVVHVDGLDGSFALINNGNAFEWNGK